MIGWLQGIRLLSKGRIIGKSRERSENGGGGIRTLDTVTRIPAFEAGAFNRSATPPNRSQYTFFYHKPCVIVAAQKNLSITARTLPEKSPDVPILGG